MLPQGYLEVLFGEKSLLSYSRIRGLFAVLSVSVGPLLFLNRKTEKNCENKFPNKTTCNSLRGHVSMLADLKTTPPSEGQTKKTTEGIVALMRVLAN
jgi:hypothetical protein